MYGRRKPFENTSSGRGPARPASSYEPHVCPAKGLHLRDVGCAIKWLIDYKRYPASTGGTRQMASHAELEEYPMNHVL